MSDGVAPLQFVGPIRGVDGAELRDRSNRDAAKIIAKLNADYQEAVQRGDVYTASNQAAQAVSVALATTYTGLMLSNPLGSGKDLVLMMANWALSVAPAAIASLHLIGGYSATVNVTHTAAVTPENALIGSGNSPLGKVDSQATIPTPTYKWSLSHGFTAAALPGGPIPTFEAKGLFVLKPGGFLGFGALTAVTGFGSLAWMEVPSIT